MISRAILEKYLNVFEKLTRAFKTILLPNCTQNHTMTYTNRIRMYQRHGILHNMLLMKIYTAKRLYIYFSNGDTAGQPE